jgi:ATP-dependent helicase HrpB
VSERLPIYEIEKSIISTLAASRRLILQAPTGSGKSTQVPQMLLRHGLLETGQVVILQPRRLAARLLASRVARELNVELGREVGYQIRFENMTSRATRIKFETEGILLRQLVDDTGLTGIQAVIFDEFHERHLYGDITLARALDIQEQSRPDLFIVVMSATLDARALEKYLSPSAVLRSEGRTFPVIVDYLPHRVSGDRRPIWEIAADAFSEHVRHPGGDDRGDTGDARPDVLVFMPGSYEIHRTIEAIRHKSESKGYLILPLHGELPPRDQDQAVARHDQPKVVVATNVAETSITIEGIRLVIDSGMARIPRYDAHRGINTLLVERISQSSAEQRTGRAGRTAPGKCVRLWSKSEHAERPAQELPETQRLDLSEVVLTLKAAGVDDLIKFRWLEAPPEKALNHAEQLLVDLGALQPNVPSTVNAAHTVITGLGRRMLAFPVHPRYARMLLAAEEYGCVRVACLIAALTQGRDLLVRNPSKGVVERRQELFAGRDSSDFWILIRAFDYAVGNQFQIDTMREAGIHGLAARQVGPLYEQFLQIAKDEGLHIERGGSKEIEDEEVLRKCILIGFSDRVARIEEGTLRCELVHGRRGMLARESVTRRRSLVVAAEIQEIGGRPGEVNTIVSLATAIEQDWLRELFPDDMKSEVRARFESPSRSVQAADVLLFRDLVLESKRIDPPAEVAARLLADEILGGRLPLPHWDHGVDQWILRLNLLSEWCPELQLPPIGDDSRRHVIEHLCLGAFSYKDIKERDVHQAVRSWLSGDQRQLVDKYAPERVTLSNGRTPKVVYDAAGPPYISIRIQELFGVTETPRIAMRRVPLSIHILAPSMRPVQVTQDLANFWRDHYPRIKSELQRKYPKHEWR